MTPGDHDGDGARGRPSRRVFRPARKARGSRNPHPGQAPEAAPSGTTPAETPEQGPGPADGRLPEGAGNRDGRVRAFLGHVTERVIAAAPRIPVRDETTLRAHFPGLGREEIADRLVAGAVRGSSAVGAGVGAVAMMPVPPAMPAQLTAETVSLVCVEVKLIAELHELYGRRAPGGTTRRTAAYLQSWTNERGIDVINPASLTVSLGGGLKREMTRKLLKRTARSLPTLTPFLVGAAVGAVLNRRDTQRLADRVRADLRSAPPLPGR